MNFDRLKEDAGQTWRWLAEGWRAISGRAANALTYFSPARENRQEVDRRDLRWGVLAVDVSEHADHVLVELEVPGLDKEDIDVTVADGQLMVSGSKRYEAERKEGSLRITERAFGEFRRVIPLPGEVAGEGAQATYKRGVLKVKVPRASLPRARKIKVLSGS
ncbi:MAG: Hsp20/alpha crystallin family protein [Pseudomonadales bacterium]|nr:Hsp20/alpha crystallin family protein [Pseudomonadales bacterium]